MDKFFCPRTPSPYRVYLTDEKEVCTVSSSNNISPQNTVHLKYGILQTLKSTNKYEYKIQKNDDDCHFTIPNGTYIFVKMLDNEIRIVECITESVIDHFSLSNNAKEVVVAGKITFDECGEIISWNNESTDYPSDNNVTKFSYPLPSDLFVEVKPINNNYAK